MLKNRNTVDVKQIKQTIIMGCAVLPSKMLNVYTGGGFLSMIATREA